MSFPWHDWQFWVATAIALAALLLILRPFLPSRRKPSGSCPGCPSGTPNRPKRTPITIQGKRLS